MSAHTYIDLMGLNMAKLNFPCSHKPPPAIFTAQGCLITIACRPHCPPLFFPVNQDTSVGTATNANGRDFVTKQQGAHNSYACKVGLKKANVVHQAQRIKGKITTCQYTIS